MITLLTGVPGSGKTLYAVWLAEKLQNDGREVFTDIAGYKGGLAAPDDWRQCPAGSVIIYDECQNRFPAIGRGRSQNELITAMETHRHLGLDLILITQRPGKLHHDVRAVVGLHHHFLRVYGLERAKMFTKDSLIADTLSAHQLRECDQKFWSFPKHLYHLYDSAEKHTHKAYMPNYMKWALSLCILGVIGIALLYDRASNVFKPSSDKPAVSVNSVESLPQVDFHEPIEQKPAEIVSLDPFSPQSLKKLSACLSIRDLCTCYDEDFFVIHQQVSDCLRMQASLPVYVRRQPEQQEIAAIAKPTSNSDADTAAK